MVRKKTSKSFHSTALKVGKNGKDDELDKTHGSESDESLQWEDFFGSSVDIASALLDMYDRSVSKEPQPKDPASNTGENNLSSGVHGAKKETVANLQPISSSRPRHNLPTGAKLHLSLSPLQGKDCPRPLSSSSLSSSSSSSSSSPRRDSKKLYLASIESLDDEFSEDCSRRTAKSRDQSPPDRVRNKAENMSLYEGSQSNCSTHSVASIPLQTSGSRNSSLSHTDRVILEIMETERTYVQDLQEIIEGYLQYIPGNAGTRVDIRSLTDLFCNIEDIYNFNRAFLQDLEMCGLDSVAVARCFFKHSYGFAIYTQYCTNYPRTVSILTDLMRNSETAEVFKERQIALCHNLPLGSYLLKPVQRILRYRLLLENIVKTSNKDCEGYADIKNALSVMTGIAYHINDMKKRHENAVRVQEIQSLLYGWDGHDLTTYGELVAEGAFRMYRTKTLRHLFIFDKMLLIVKKKEEGILCYKTHIMCSNLMLIESIQGEPLCFHVIPFDNPREQYTFQARNGEQKREWCLQLKRVILENYNAVIPSHARQLVMELGQSKQEGSVPLEKSSSKRQLSAPEYLEKRKQERRKSESNLKPFKIKKGAKKVRDLSPSFKSVISGYDRHSHQSLSASYDGVVDSKESVKPHGRWRRASVDAIPGKMNHSNDEIQRSFGTPSYADTCVSDSEKRSNVHFPFHYKEYGCEKERSDAGKRQHKSLPEETTDTENDDLLYFRPPPQTLSVSEEINGISDDVGGEYVTFYFTNNNAQRQQSEIITPVIMVEDSYDDGYCTLSPNMFLPDPTSSLYVGQSSGKVSDSSSCSNDSHKTSNNDMKISADYDNLVYLWTRLGTIQINSETDNASECSVHTPSLRRVHSFTGIEEQSYNSSSREKNSLGFMQTNSVPRDGNSNSSLQLPSSSDILSPPSPSPCVSEQEDYVSSYTQKSISLPWDFHTGKEALLLSPIHAPVSSSKTGSQHFTSVADSFLGSSSELSTAADKSQSDDFVADLEKYIENAQEKKRNSCFPVNEKEFVGNDSYSDRASTLYNSTVSINSLSLNQKMHKEEEKCSVKTVYSGSSKRTSTMKRPQDRSSCEFLSNSRSSSCDDNSNKSSEVTTMGAKFVQSLGKAYSAVVKQKNRGTKNSKTPKLQVLEKNSCLHMPGSSAIGARVAYPLDSEYCMLDSFFPLRKNKSECIESSRPDSLLSASSNLTSSWDSEKMLSSCSLNFSIGNLQSHISNVGHEEFHASHESSMQAKHTCSSTISLSSLPKMPYNSHVEQSEFRLSDSFPVSNAIAPANSLPRFFPKDDGSDYGITSTSEPCGDSPSDNSDISGDSYYEKTFEAIEDELIEQMFRDSAIYSDPDELDLNTLTHEQNIISNMNDEVLNAVVDEAENLPSIDYNTSVLNMVSAYSPVRESETTSSVFQPQRNNLFTRPVNKNIQERLECLKNQNNPKSDSDSSSLKGLKSIQERWKELEQWKNSNVGIVNSESNDDFTMTNHFPESKVNTNATPNDENNQPKGKGWVKHVVRKLQNETSS